jgi:hypothetical protein
MYANGTFTSVWHYVTVNEVTSPQNCRADSHKNLCPLIEMAWQPAWVTEAVGGKSTPTSTDRTPVGHASVSEWNLEMTEYQFSAVVGSGQVVDSMPRIVAKTKHWLDVAATVDCNSKTGTKICQ